MSGFLEILEKTMEEAKKAKKADFETGDADTLKQLGERYLARHSFAPGDLVTWKEGLMNLRFPAYGKPAIVLEVDEGQKEATDDSGSPNFQAPADVRLGILSPSGNFEGWWADGNRLQPYSEDSEAVE